MYDVYLTKNGAKYFNELTTDDYVRTFDDIDYEWSRVTFTPHLSIIMMWYEIMVSVLLLLQCIVRRKVCFPMMS